MSLELVQPPAKAGRNLPHSLDAERSVLGGVILRSAALSDVTGIVEPSDFYHPAHVAIWRAIQALDAASRPIDSLTVDEQLRAMDLWRHLGGVGGGAYICELMSSVITVENIAFHARMVNGKARVRRVIEAAQAIAARGYGDFGDADEYCEQAETEILAASVCVSAQRPLGAEELSKLVVQRAIDRSMQTSLITGVTSGIAGLDRILKGAQPGDLLVVAGRPSNGKTVLGFQWLVAAAQARQPVLGFSLEMAPDRIMERLVAAHAEVDGDLLRIGKLDGREWQRVYASRAAIGELPLELTGAARTMARIRAEARRWISRRRKANPLLIGAVTIDYLGLIDAQREKGESKGDAIGRAAKSCKELAQELGLPVILLAQLNRESEKEDRPPRMSDLRDSGEIEQHADVIIFLHSTSERHMPIREVDAIIDKARCGDTGSVALRFVRAQSRFIEAPERSGEEPAAQGRGSRPRSDRYNPGAVE